MAYGGDAAAYDRALDPSLGWAGACKTRGGPARRSRCTGRRLPVSRRWPLRMNEPGSQVGYVQADLGDCLTVLGRFAEAQSRRIRDSLENARKLGDRRSEAVVLGQLGALALATGRPGRGPRPLPGGALNLPRPGRAADGSDRLAPAGQGGPGGQGLGGGRALLPGELEA